jgi:2-polyprenyl-3-methyl-5-hydroxy-6-metoxy-1,4-benzoquinol methylase
MSNTPEKPVMGDYNSQSARAQSLWGAQADRGGAAELNGKARARTHDEALLARNAWFEERLGVGVSERSEWIMRMVGRGRRVLDLGCGSGEIASRLSQQNNDVVGIDLHPESVERAQLKGVRSIEWDLREGIPLDSGSFDVVHAGQIFDEIYDPRALLEEVGRVLRPQGLFLLSVFNLNSWENRLRVLSGSYLQRQGLSPEDSGGTRLRWFNRDQLESLLEDSGFTVESIRGIYETKGFLSHAEKTSLFSWTSKLGSSWLGRALPEWADLLLVTARRDPRA